MSCQAGKSAENPVRILNDDKKGKYSKKSAVELSKELQKTMLKMKGSLIADDGSWVRYDLLRKHKLFSQYQEIAHSLPHISLTNISEQDKTAFFINIYNALTIHGLAAHEGPMPTSVLNIRQFWRTTAYNIAGHVFSLDDIEHGILRSNRPHPASKDCPLKPDDPRIQFIAKQLDPRVHFALVCGAKSCPVINVYSSEKLNDLLDAASRNFLRQEVQVFHAQRKIHVSPIFQWYWSDFGANDVEAIRWTIPYLETSTQKDLDNLLVALEAQGMVDIHYKDYNWNLNCYTEPLKPAK